MQTLVLVAVWAVGRAIQRNLVSPSMTANDEVEYAVGVTKNLSLLPSHLYIRVHIRV